MTRLRKRRWLRRSLASALVLGAIATGLYIFVLPPYVRARIETVLRDAGIEDASFELKSVTWRGLELEKIELGKPAWVSIAAARGRYDLWSLLRGRFTIVDITGATWRVRVVDGKLILGPELTPATSNQPPDLPFDELRIADSALVLQTEGREQLFPLAAAISRTAPSRARVGISATSPVSFSTASLTAAAEELSTAAEVAFLGGGNYAANAEIIMKGGKFHTASGTWAASNIFAAVPVSFHAGGAGLKEVSAGSFSADLIVGGKTLPRAAGAVSLTESRLDATVTWPLLEGAVLAAEGHAEFADGLRGEMTATLPEFELTDSDELAAILPALRDADIGGTIALDARLTFSDGELRPMVTLTAEDLMINNPDWTAGIESARGSITINSFAPLATAADQTITIENARIGALEIGESTLTFTLASQNLLLISAASILFVDKGQFSAKMIEIDPAHPAFSADLLCEDVELGQWLELFAGDKVGAEGTLQGRIRLLFDPDDVPMFQILGGSLAANPPTGWIRVQDRDELRRLLESGELGPMGDVRVDAVKQRIIDALQDFEFDDFRVDFISDDLGEDVISRIWTRGKGRGPEGQQFGGLTVNVIRFNHALDDVLWIQQTFAPD